MQHCDECGKKFSRFWRQHLNSTHHKRSCYHHTDDDEFHPIFGKIIRRVDGNRCVNIMFPSLEAYREESKKFKNNNKNRPVPDLLPIQVESVTVSKRTNFPNIESKISHYQNLQLINS